MVYCTKCGTKNDDSAQYCVKCGNSLKTSSQKPNDDWDRRCEEECAGGKSNRGWSIFWGLVIVLIGIWIIFEIVLKNLAQDIPELSWVNSIIFPFWWIIVAIFAIMLIITGLRIISK